MLGMEQWLSSGRYFEALVKNKEYRAAYARHNSAAAVEKVRRWREDNPDRFNEQKAKNDQRVKAAKRWAAALRYYHKLLGCLEKPKVSKFKGNKFDGYFLRLYVTPRQAAMIHKLLVSHIDEKRFIEV